MTARLPSDLLNRSAEESARLLALSYLGQIERAQAVLADPGHTEALHDFRVGLRRLRSSTRAYRSQLEGSMTKKMERRLRNLSLVTNGSRDTEVQLDWLRKQVDRVAADDIQGVSWLIGRLEGRKYETLDPAVAQVGRRFLKAAAKLRPRLATLRVELGPDHPKKSPSFGQVTGNLVQHQVARLRDDLARIHGAANAKEVHRARISIKRLRYLLEPVARRAPRARDLVRHLKDAQDLLGNVHDMHVLSGEITSSIAALAASASDPAPEPTRGLQTLERLATEQAAAAFESFEAAWGGERARRFLTRAGELGRSLTEGLTRVSPDTASPKPARAVEAPPISGKEGPPRHDLRPVELASARGAGTDPLFPHPGCSSGS